MENNQKKKAGKMSHRLLWALLSLLASLLLWVYVTNLESDEYKQTLRGVKVELVGQSVLKDSRNLAVTGLNTNTVSIEIIGPRRLVASLDSEDVTAQIDVSKLSQSSYTSLSYSVNYPNGTDTSKIRVNRKIPETVSFMVSKLSEKTVPVRGSFDGSTAEGYTARPAVYEPETITISGPEVNLKDISYAWVSFGDENISSTYSVETGYALHNEAGETIKVDGVTFSHDLVKATLPILELKELPLTVNLIYGAGSNESNTKVSIDPSTVTLAGDSSILDGINNIPIATIDLTDFTATFTDDYPIVYDNSLINVSGESDAKVTVEVVGLETRKFKITNLSVVNVTDGYIAEIVSKSIDVTIRGTKEQLDSILPENLRAVADLVDYDITTGSLIVPVKVYIDGATDGGALGENSISIDIRKEVL